MTNSLPDRGTVAGGVARVIMAEARDPSNPSYVAADTLTSMQWMKRVLQNRLDNNPAQFLAPHAKSLIDIIKAPGQFAGFQHYPHYDADLASRLQSIIDISNRPKDARSADYATFVQNARSVAGADPISDPTLASNPKSLGLFAWRTAGTAPPGGRFAKFKDLAGNTFYMLTS